MKKLCALISVLLLSGCLTTSSYTGEEPLKPEEGILLTSFPCYAALVTLEIYEASTLSKKAKINCSFEDPLKTILLPQGEYYVGSAKVFYGGKGGQLDVNKASAYHFYINAEKTNYIGNISLRFNPQTTINPSSMRVGWRFFDSEKEIREKLSINYPNMITKHPYRKVIAKK